MSDFLTSLTARSFGTETMIRPRISSLFEPVRNFDTPSPEPVAANPTETDVSTENEAEANFERKISRPRTSLHERVSDVTHPTDENPASLVIASPRDDFARRKTTARIDEEWQQHEWKEEDTALTATVRPRRTPLSQSGNLNDSESLLRPELEDVAPQRAAAKPRAVSPAHDEPLEKDHRGLVLAPNAVAELTAQMKNAALAMNIATGSPRKEQAGSARPVQARESEPVVHVTIGRIEVRATSESKNVGRPRIASPVMSLEDYLHRRSQRGNQ